MSVGTDLNRIEGTEGKNTMATCVLILVLHFLSEIPQFGSALDNGLGLAPPMGWMSWQRFKCVTDCVKHPRQCISEDLVKRMATAMVRDGFLAAGYNYVALDDCWMSRQRDVDGNLVPDPKRFPSGIKKLAEFLHDLGLKLGIYGAVGPKTCMGFPGNAGHLARDAKLYAEWGVDMLKLDGCFVPLKDLEPAYTSMSRYLNSTGRPMLFFCSWPYYLLLGGQKAPWPLISRHCNAWRMADDVSESRKSIMSIINTFNRLQSPAGPGGWNDADQLLVGNQGFGESDAKLQMAMWAIFASPLFISVDFDEIPKWAKELLQNDALISINQDPLGRSGRRLASSPVGVDVWVKELTEDRLALAFLSDPVDDETDEIVVPFSLLHPFYSSLSVDAYFSLHDAFDDMFFGAFRYRDKFLVRPESIPVVRLLILTPLPPDRILDEEDDFPAMMRQVDRDLNARRRRLRAPDERRRRELIIGSGFVLSTLVIVSLLIYFVPGARICFPLRPLSLLRGRLLRCNIVSQLLSRWRAEPGIT